jgi:hypothetical protein
MPNNPGSLDSRPEHNKTLPGPSVDRASLSYPSSANDPIITSPADEARQAFDAGHNVEPCHMIAVGIAARYGIRRTHPIVDDMSHAIEDAPEIGDAKIPLPLSQHIAATFHPSRI